MTCVAACTLDKRLVWLSRVVFKSCTVAIHLQCEAYLPSWGLPKLSAHPSVPGRQALICIKDQADCLAALGNVPIFCHGLREHFIA